MFVKEATNPKKIEKYSLKEVLESAIKYFKGDELAANVWINKYALKDQQGNVYELNPEQMHLRIANEIARVEKNYPNSRSVEEIFELIKDFKYIIPQGGPMSGIGNNFQVVSLSNCFVIGIEGRADSYSGIIRIDEEQVQLMKRRGGVGHDLSHIRPKGSVVMNSALSSTGIVPFMERYSNSTREVAQDGRRGALMLSISIKHPDAEDFIDAKTDSTKVTGANISVKLDDEFMQAVKDRKKYIQKFPVDSPTPRVVKEIDAYKLFKKIVHNAWKSAEPGILFWDTIINESVADSYAKEGFKTVSTNPCGEIPLCPYDSCRLLAINLYSYVDKPFAKEARFDFELFKKHVQEAIRMMDDIIDLELEKLDYILEKIKEDPENQDLKKNEYDLWHKIGTKALKGRRMGVGITAEGDMLAALGLTYGTKEATEFAVLVQKTLAIEAYRSSVILAKERGPMPIYDAKKEEKNPFILRIKAEDEQLYKDMVEYGRRNISLLTIAPTGTTSLMTQTTSGIEPAFLIAYKRRRKVNPNEKDSKVDFVDEIGDSWEEFNVFHPKFLKWLKVNGYNLDEVKSYKEEQLNEVVKKSPYFKATANDVDWIEKVRMQGAIQKWVDHSISVTVNVPKETKEDLIEELYITAWESGCKGSTVYRDGSRSGVLVKKDSESQSHEIKEWTAPERPKTIEASIVRFHNNSEKWIAVVGLLKGRPYEIFTGVADAFIIPPNVNNGWIIKNRNKDGSSRYDFKFLDKDGYEVLWAGLSRAFNKEFWNYAKLISGVLRQGMPLTVVIDLVDNLSLDDDSINTWKKGVARALKKFVPDGTKVSDKKCPECGDSDGLVFKEGCLVCISCGYSKCG